MSRTSRKTRVTDEGTGRTSEPAVRGIFNNEDAQMWAACIFSARSTAEI
jgi:hypothetical protein